MISNYTVSHLQWNSHKSDEKTAIPLNSYCRGLVYKTITTVRGLFRSTKGPYHITRQVSLVVNPGGVHPSSNGMSRLIACQSKHTTSISLTMAPCSAYQCNGPHYSNPRSSSTNGRNSRAISQRLAVPNHWSMVEHHRLCFS